MNVPWPADPLRIPEPPPTVTRPDGERLEIVVVPVSGFAWANWPANTPQPKD